VAALAILTLLIRAAAAAALLFSVQVEGEKDARVTIAGPAADLAPGPFRGAITLNGSPSEMPVAGTVVHAGGRWQLTVPVRYAEVPADWADRFAPQTFTYRLKGSGAGAAPREWSGTAAWKDVEIEGDKDVLARFLALEDVQLTEFSLLSSEAEARLAIHNPLGFELKIAETSYTLFVDGRVVGEGATRGLILHPARRNVLALPVSIDHGELIAAAGQALLAGGDVEVRLRGRMVLRLKGGDIAVPLDLSGRLTDAS
jgi:LEA14-like dessication related protein